VSRGGMSAVPRHPFRRLPPSPTLPRKGGGGIWWRCSDRRRVHSSIPFPLAGEG
jgi:hypothetical protein